MFKIFVVLFFPLLAHSLERKEFRINDFSCGLVLGQGYQLGGVIGRINPGCSRDARNVYFSKNNGAVIARERYRGANSAAVNSNSNATVQWGANFSSASGAGFIIVRSSQVMARCHGNAPLVCTVINDVTLNSTTPIQGVVTLNRAWFVGGGTTAFSVDRDLVVRFHPSAAQGNLIGYFRNRILIAGVIGNESTLYLSGQDNGADWTLGSQSTSPMTFLIGGSDNPERVTCLMGIQDDTFRVGTTDRIHSLVGVDQDDLRMIETLNTGCYMPRSAVVFPDGAMIWLGNEGFYELSSNRFNIISTPISTLARRISNQGRFHVNKERVRNFTAGNHRGDYWFSYVISADTGYVDNNLLLVYERPGNVWTQFTGINASSFFDYGSGCNSQDSFHFGNSNGDGSIYVFGIQGSQSTHASGCPGTEEPAYEASFELWPFDGGDPSTLKAFETAYVVTHSTPHEFFANYDPMQTRVFYTMDAASMEAGSEISVATITSQAVSRLQAPRINFSQSGVGSIPKGRWISLGFSSILQKNPLLIEDIILYYTLIGRL